MYIVCPELLSVVGDNSYGMRVGFIESDKVLAIYFYLFTSEVKSQRLPG